MVAAFIVSIALAGWRPLVTNYYLRQLRMYSKRALSAGATQRDEAYHDFYLNKLVETGEWKTSVFYFTDDYRVSTEKRRTLLKQFPKFGRGDLSYMHGSGRITLFAPKQQFDKYVQYLRSHDAISDEDTSNP